MLPSILSADFGAFRSQVVELLDAGARAFHVDVMDGHFVPVITFGPRVVSSFADLVHERGGTLDVHLMIEQPERQLAEFAKAGADSCTVHVETCPHLHHTLGLIHELGMTAGATLNPATPDGRAARGGARGRRAAVHVGQPRLGRPEVHRGLDRAARASCKALLRPGMGLEVDGGVAPATIERCHAAGANLMVAGSAIYDQPSPGEAWQALAALVADA